MAKLEDIPKQEIFNVPEDYFEKLPVRIQSRLIDTKVLIGHSYLYVWRWALPLLLMIGITVFFYNDSPVADTEAMLVSVQPSELVQFLNDSDFNTEDLLENADYLVEDLDEIENEVYDFGLVDIQDEEDLNML